MEEDEDNHDKHFDTFNKIFREHVKSIIERGKKALESLEEKNKELSMFKSFTWGKEVLIKLWLGWSA